jgi:hypothetical protein
MKTKKILSDVPKRHGPLYCSPMCGRGCRAAWHKEATRNAQRLCRLLGPEWKPHVFENLGWHYEARRGEMSVTRSYGHHWGPEGPEVCSAYFGRWVAHASTARGAVRKLCEKIRADAAELAAIVARLPA